MSEVETIEITDEKINGWEKCTLGEVAEYLNGRAFKPKEWENGGLPIIRIQNLNDPDASYNYTTEDYKDRYKVENDDLLFAWSASLDAYIWKGNDAWLNQHIFKVVPKDFINKHFLYYYLKSIIRDLYAKSHGSGMVHVTKKKFEKTEIFVPPLPTQNCIVEKIEELFSDLDNGIENLKKAKQQLKTYKQSVLKAAFEGKLTKKWREQQDDLPTPEELKEQIEEERKHYREQQLEGWRQKVKEWEEKGEPGRKPWKPRKPKKVDSIASKEIKDFPQLPNEWNWIRMGKLMSKPKYGTSQKCSYDIDGTPVLRIPNIGYGVIKDDDLKFSEFTNKERKKYTLESGDILTIRSNGSVNLVGKCAVVREPDTDYLYAGYLIRLRPYKNNVSSKFMYYALNTITLRRQIENKAKSTSGVNNINSGELQHLILPICTYKEQKEIVNSIESKLSVVDQNLLVIDQELQKAEALRQSILKKAFNGELVEE